jgi:hypothetical protein
MNVTPIRYPYLNRSSSMTAAIAITRRNITGSLASG